MREQVLKHVLKNEIEHGTANAKVVLGKVLASEPELRSRAQEVSEEIGKLVQETGSWSEGKKREELLRIWPGALEKKEVVEKEALRPLPNVKGKVVMRFAPNPNGPPTLGSSRGIVINAEYCRKYNGRFICRFDDTDPSLKKPLKQGYEWYLEDMEWLGCPPDKVVYASDRIGEYYKVAEELVMKRAAYVCQCDAEAFRKLKAVGKECPCRHQANSESLRLWRDMLGGKFKEGEAVLRIKTDMQHKDPAIRDWVGFRVRKGAHPRVGKRYPVWPMLDFESAVEDRLQGVTHIIRGKDLRDSTERQKYLYSYMEWDYPETMYWGRVAVHEFGKLSTSGIREGIENKEYTGWDDPRLPTLRALRRRGFSPAAITKFWMELGLTEKDVRASMETIESFNKTIIDPLAKRYFFVASPKKVKVKDIPATRVLLRYRPDSDKRTREYEFEGEQVFFVPEAPGLFRLKDAFNVKKKGKGFVYAGEEMLGCPKLQWVSDSVKAELVTPEGTQKGVVEAYAKELKKNQEVQLERVGYARVDSVSDKKIVFWLTHA